MPPTCIMEDSTCQKEVTVTSLNRSSKPTVKLERAEIRTILPDQKVRLPLLDWISRIQIGMLSPNPSRPTIARIWIIVVPALPLILLFTLLSLHVFCPELRIYTRKFLQLSHYSETSENYTPGLDDVWFVCAWVLNLTALRAIIIEWMLQPLAFYLGVEKKLRLRLAEQGWLVIYDGTIWTLGMVCTQVTRPTAKCMACWNCCSIFGTILSIGSTMTSFGLLGHQEICPELSRGTTLFR